MAPEARATTLQVLQQNSQSLTQESLVQLGPQSAIQIDPVGDKADQRRGIETDAQRKQIKEQSKT